MNRFMANAAMWWSGRTVREQRMLMMMVVLLLATAILLGVIRPVLAWRANAADRAAAAATALVEVRMSIVTLAPAPSAGGTRSADLEPLVRRTSEAAGLEVVTLMSPEGQLGFQLSRVGSGPLFAWLAALETDHRLAICSLGVTENTDATLNVEGSVAAGACAG